jgi:hypothetical protein
MTSKTTRLKVFSTKQLAVDHGDSADAGAKGHHYNFRETSGRACVEFTQKGHPRIILDPQRQA